MPNPIKRHECLQPLSREHHQGLLLSWKIRQGIAKKVEISRIKSYINWFWENHLEQHFEFEETHIFPILDPNLEIVERVLNEHRRLKKLFTTTKDIEKSIALIEEELVSHIRFEERIFFKEIEKMATDKEWHLIKKNHIAVNKTNVQKWDDEFWK